MLSGNIKPYFPLLSGFKVNLYRRVSYDYRAAKTISSASIKCSFSLLKNARHLLSCVRALPFSHSLCSIFSALIATSNGTRPSMFGLCSHWSAWWTSVWLFSRSIWLPAHSVECINTTEWLPISNTTISLCVNWLSHKVQIVGAGHKVAWKSKYRGTPDLY